MRIIITKSQLNSILTEQSVTPTSPGDYRVTATDDRPSTSSSRVKGKETSTWNKYLETIKSIGTSFSLLAEYFVNLGLKLGINKDSVKVRLIFPQYKWELDALKKLKEMKIVTGFFDSVETATKTVQTLAENNIKASELVVGSHGDGEKIIMSIKGDDYKFSQTFLSSLKGIIKNDTTVFFTACYGADYLKTLVDAAKILGVGVYGSSGIYNYITNDSEKGFYFCNPKDYSTLGLKITDRKLRNSFDESDDFVFYTTNKNPIVNLLITPTFLTNLGFTHNLKNDLNLVVRRKYIIRLSERYIFDKTGKLIEKYKINPEKIILKNEELKKFVTNYTNSTSEKFRINLVGGYNSGELKIILDDQNISTIILPDVYEGPNGEDMNFYLLESNICKKVENSPVSWAETI